MKKIFALVDCNNFYCSCERVFNPSLEGKPVVVLSNNDGCIISRSAEAKARGIPMGAPYHKTPLENVEVFSSNYALYGDMSQRVMEILEDFTDDVEVYSIDEAFLDFSGLRHLNLTEYSKEIQQKIQKWLGLPISIGIGESKTLAKIANKISKKNKEFNGILNLVGYKQIDSLLSNVPVNDVWGIGRRTARKLERYGINTAKQLKYADDLWILKKFGVTIQRTVWELRGQGVERHDGVPEKKKGICNSRSFGKPVYSIDDIKEAVSDYVTTAAAKLRKQNSVAGVLLVYLRSHNFSDEKYYSNLAQIKIAKPTNDTIELISYAIEGVEKIFKKGYNYKKTGVILTDIIPVSEIQEEIFDSPEENEKKAGLMKAMDLVNKKFGWKKLRVASSGIEQSWWMRSNMRTPAYTTDWKQIPKVKA